MSLSDKLTQVNTAKQNMKTAFTNKGLDVSSTPFTDYYTLIDNIFSPPMDYYVSNIGSDSNTGTSISSPFLTLAKAVTTATSGQSIGVLAGVYTGTNNCGLTISKNLNIYGSSNVIFDGENTRMSGWILGSNSTSYVVNVNGITFKNGSAAGVGAITNFTTGIISNCTFINNAANNVSSAIWNFKTGIISNCTFMNNTSPANGAIYNQNTGAINKCDFLTNTKYNICNGATGVLIDGCYWNTSRPTTASYNSTLNGTVPTNNRTTPNHPERIT